MRALAFAAFAALASASADVPLDTVLIENAYFRQPAPGRSVAAAYCKMTNNTGVQLTLVSFESPVAKSVEVHTTVRVGDMMRMQRLDGITLPPHETVQLAPGGMHFMLFGVGPLDVDTYPFTLRFSDGSSVTVPFRVMSFGVQPQ